MSEETTKPTETTETEETEGRGACKKCGCSGFEGSNACLGDDGSGGVCGHRKSDHR